MQKDYKIYRRDKGMVGAAIWHLLAFPAPAAFGSYKVIRSDEGQTLKVEFLRFGFGEKSLTRSRKAEKHKSVRISAFPSDRNDAYTPLWNIL